MGINYSCGNSKQGSNTQVLKEEQLNNEKKAIPQISLKVKSGEMINLIFYQNLKDTEVKIVSGSRDTTFVVGTEYQMIRFMSEDTKMTVYGNILEFGCADNYGNVTDVDVSKNTALTKLYLFGNELKRLDISKNIALKEVECGLNKLKTLDVSKNLNLIHLYCMGNQLTTLDVSKNIALTQLHCSDNQLTKLNLNKNTALQELFVGNKELSDVTIGSNKTLDVINCHEELPYTCYEKILTSLPDRHGLEKGSLMSKKYDRAINQKIEEKKNWEIIME